MNAFIWTILLINVTVIYVALYVVVQDLYGKENNEGGNNEEGD